MGVVSEDSNQTGFSSTGKLSDITKEKESSPEKKLEEKEKKRKSRFEPVVNEDDEKSEKNGDKRKMWDMFAEEDNHADSKYSVRIYVFVLIGGCKVTLWPNIVGLSL